MKNNHRIVSYYKGLVFWCNRSTVFRQKEKLTFIGIYVMIAADHKGACPPPVIRSIPVEGPTAFQLPRNMLWAPSARKAPLFILCSDYLRPPRRLVRRSALRRSDSLLSEAAMNCFKRSSKLVGSLGAAGVNVRSRGALFC